MRARIVVLALAVLVGGGCRKPLPPAPPRAASGPAARDMTASPGLGLEKTCTPTGPELCFNAIDDNCNGVLDEGCGVETGVLQFLVAWDEPADLELDVFDPKGQKQQAEGTGESAFEGFRKDRSCGGPEENCHGQNVENVYYEGSSPPRGRYRIVVRVEKPNGATFPLHARLGVRVGGRTYAGKLELASPEDTKELAFTL